MFEFTSHLNSGDIQALADQVRRRSSFLSKIFVVLIAIAVSLFVNGVTHEVNTRYELGIDAYIVNFISVIVILLLWILLRYAIRASFLKNHIYALRRNRAALITIDSGGVSIRVDRRNFDLVWSDVSDVAETGDLVFLLRGQKVVLLLRKIDMGDDRRACEIFSFIKQHLYPSTAPQI